jgi:hypothetical protein
VVLVGTPAWPVAAARGGIPYETRGGIQRPDSRQDRPSRCCAGPPVEASSPPVSAADVQAGQGSAARVRGRGRRRVSRRGLPKGLCQESSFRPRGAGVQSNDLYDTEIGPHRADPVVPSRSGAVRSGPAACGRLSG